jgi:hypothetical protein
MEKNPDGFYVPSTPFPLHPHTMSIQPSPEPSDDKGKAPPHTHPKTDLIASKYEVAVRTTVRHDYQLSMTRLPRR